jgi:hypothetical protein
MKRKSSDKSSREGQQVPGPALQASPEAASWMPLTRLAFRFCFVYLGLFALATQISGSMIPNLSFYYRGMGRLWPMREVTFWTARHIFGAAVVDETGTGGEPLFFWLQAFWLLVVALLATAIWSVLDRRRKEYVILHRWFRVFIRFALAAAMLEYGMTKVIPTQFPAPSLEALVTPTGDMTLSALLWTTIGAAPAYEILTGCIEVLGGILLLVPRTTTLGALISMAAMIQVLSLNMTFDIGLKLVSLHLIVLALFLLAPEASRFADFFLRNRPTGASIQPQLFASEYANRLALILQLVFGLYLLGMYAYINMRFWDVGGGGSPRSPLYGVWNVEELSVDGLVRVPELNDYDRRWRRVIFDAPASVTFQRTDDSFARFGASVDTHGKTLTLTKGNSKTWKTHFTFANPSADKLELDGEMDGHQIRVRLRLVEFDTFRLLNSSFRWVRPHDP